MQHETFVACILYGASFIAILTKAHELLKEGHHDQCALSLFFFSDGQCTDHKKRGITRKESIQMMKDVISSMASDFGIALTVNMVGLGNQYDDFSSLQELAAAATAGGAKGSFERCERTANSISSAISTLVTSTAETRLALQEGQHRGYTQRSDLVSERETAVNTKWNYFRIDEHFVYDPRARKFWKSHLLPLAVAYSPEARERASERRSNPPYLAINAHYFGKGAERVAFRCRLSEFQEGNGFVFGEMIAKETKDVERYQERRDFHEGN